MRDAAYSLICAEALLQQRRLTEAFSLFHRAELEGSDPDRCAAGRWMTAMLSGDFEAAWRESDAIARRGKPDPVRLWQGEELRGRRIVLRCLHGLGDAVQLLRYAPRLRDLAAYLLVECAPCAVDLVRCFPGIDEVISWEPSAPAMSPDWDVQLEIMELPYIFRTTLAELPMAVNYLTLPLAEVERAAYSLRPSTCAIRVGIVWSSGEWNLTRSLQLPTLAPILRRTDCQFWNLQGGAVRKEWQTLESGTHICDTPVLADGGLISLAAVIAHLDLVVTVDTLAAHLAGALNIRCFLLLQHAADWRWMVGRNDSPWYPSLRLFRQPAPGDWASAVRGLDETLSAFVIEKMKVRIVA